MVTGIFFVSLSPISKIIKYMDLGLKTLSDVTTWSKYAKYIPELNRRETWDEIVDRYEVMMVKRYPELKSDIIEKAVLIRDKKVLPSMRSLQFAGPAIAANEVRGYNCAFLHIDSYHAFSEAMFLLLAGTGIGYSVQKHHVEKLPSITVPTKNRKFVVSDDIMGWADAVKALMKAFLCGRSLPIFDFSQIRHKGARLITAGGRAPGPTPLKIALSHIQAILEQKNEGETLSPLECHDILCHIANAVLSGGIRRAAMLSLFSICDNEMLTCKFGNWWELNEQRGRANNSVVLVRGEVQEEEFKELWEKIEASGSGEPGFYWTNDREKGTNPCVEIGLNTNQFCNLCEVNSSDIKDQEDFNHRVRVASFFGTLQAGFTDFHYLRSIWNRTTEKEALLGIGMTGIASDVVTKLNLTEAAEIAVELNKRISTIIGINPAARVTCIKPSGTTSCVLGTSSGIHGWHDNYYLRTIRFNTSEAIAGYIMDNHPGLWEKDVLRPHDTICVRIPCKAPKGSILRHESAIDLLERVKKFSTEWIKPGHIEGVNSHNVSATISIDKAKTYITHQGYDWTGQPVLGEYDEWEMVGKWMWDNKDFYNGLSVLPYNGGTYTQAPFETITEDEFNERIKLLKDIDVTQIQEFDDNVQFGDTVACAGGACEI